MSSIYVHKSHNVTVLIYHLVFPAKYRRVIFDDEVDEVMKDVCMDIEARYQIKFLEIGTDKDHLHFLIQSVPTYPITKIVTIIKKYNCTGDIQEMPPHKEETLGWRVLVRRIFCRDSRQTW